MSNVVLSIGGRKFTVSCADGEEEHVAGLGRMIDERVASLGENAGQNEVRMLLYTALVLADELEEAQRASAPQPAPTVKDVVPQLAGRLTGIADTLEKLADRLEQDAGDP